MKTLVITNDYSPKKGGISTYIQSFCKNLNFETYIYAPNWAEGENVINSKYNFIFSGKRFFHEINDINAWLTLSHLCNGHGTRIIHLSLTKYRFVARAVAMN